MLLLNVNRNYNNKAYMDSPIPSHLTLSDIDRSKLRCRKWSKIDTCIARYCLRFKLIYKSAENSQCHINCSCQAECQGPWISCWFLALLCATTAQQSYCRHMGVCLKSIIRRHHFLGYHWMNYRQILGTGTYLPYLQTIFFVFENLNFWLFYDFFFVFVNMGPYGRNNFKWHLL